MSAAVFVRDLTAFSIQIALIVAAVALLVKAMQIPARARYHGLRLALAAALIVPWLLRTTDAPRPAVAEPAPQVLLTPGAALPATPVPNEASTAVVEPRFEIPWLLVLLGVVGIGVAGRGLWLAAGLVRLRQLTKSGAVVDEPEYAELQEQIGVRATIAQVAGLAQPATFGVRRPVVLLPDALAAAPRPLRRAVIIHELYHVRRRDWLFLLMEEMVRTVFWFHPAILWLTSHIQLAREEIVDELTVHATGDRRGYMQALLTFADSGGLRPAPAFARRRQLFHRILSVSKEKVMSRPRIVLSAAVLVVVVLTASWSASLLFPIVKAGSATVTPGSLAAVEDNTRGGPAVPLFAPDPLPAPVRTRESVRLDQQTGAVVTPRQVTPENPIPRRSRGGNIAWPPQYAAERFQIAVNTFVTLGPNGAVISVRRGGCAASEPGPAGPERLEAACGAFFDAVAAAVRQWQYDRPVQAPLEFNVVVTFRPGSEPDVLQSSAPIAVASSRDYAGPAWIPDALTNRAAAGATARESLAELTARSRELERAIRIESERLETLRSSNPSNPEQVVLVLRRLQELRARLQEIERQLAQSGGQPDQAAAADVRPTPTTTFDGPPQLRSPSGRAPVRVTPGVVAAPRVIKSVHPSYTAEAMHARIEGTVQVEALIDEQGRVADARVIRSLPLLDETALAAARQWEFSPTLLNGQPVPVLVMLELHFALR